MEAVEAERRHPSTAPAQPTTFGLQTLQGPVLAPANARTLISAAKGSSTPYQGGAGLLFPRPWLLADAVPCKYLLPTKQLGRDSDLRVAFSFLGCIWVTAAPVHGSDAVPGVI